MAGVGGVQGGIQSMLLGIAQIEAEMVKNKANGTGSTGAGQFAQQLQDFSKQIAGLAGGQSSDAVDDEGIDMSYDADQANGTGSSGQQTGETGTDSDSVENLLKIIEQLTDMLKGGASDDAAAAPVSGSGSGGGGSSDSGLIGGGMASQKSLATGSNVSSPSATSSSASQASGSSGGSGSASTASSSSSSGMDFLKNGKEGLGVSPTSANGSDVSGKKASWYYDWSPQALSSSQSNGAQFIPMVWGQKDMTAANLQSIAKSDAPMVLAFNEPERADQANMSVSQAIDAWPQLEQAAAGKQLSSPAVSSAPEGKAWLNDFLGQADAKGLKVDSISVHWYGDNSKSVSQNVADLKSYIESIQNLPNAKGRPINLTEFGLSPNGNSAQANPEFLAQAEKMLNGMSGVQMYAPYGLGSPGGNG